MSEPFTTISGVRQGCLLSPLLFLVVIDAVSRRAYANANRGIVWDPLDPSRRLECLDYADDKCELSHRFSDMQDKLNDLVTESKKVGLKLNSAKTKEMRINTISSERLNLFDTHIERVDNFQYLGGYISENGGTMNDIQSRIGKALGVFTQLHKVWSSNNYSTKTKVHIFKTCVLSVLLYGCETWFVTETVKQKLRGFVNRCLRRILKIFWPQKISNEQLWSRTQTGDINVEIRRRKFGWIGHTLRKPPDEICHHALVYNPQGSRRPGRPRKTWRRSTLAEVNSIAHTLGRTHENIGELRDRASDRQRWKHLIDSLCPV